MNQNDQRRSFDREIELFKRIIFKLKDEENKNDNKLEI